MKSVSPDIYTKKYFLSDCDGYEEFNKSFGNELGIRLKQILEHTTLENGMKILDIGCGRGEVEIWAAKKGAEIIGIDYSQASIKIAKKALSKQPRRVQKKVKLIVKNAKNIDFKPNSFDRVFLFDILEHLYPPEQEIVIENAYRMLKKGGTLLAHTEPNRLYVDYTYPLWCYPMSSLLTGISNSMTKNTYPNLPHPSLLRTESHREFHINEPTYHNLKKVFVKKNFQIRILSKVIIKKPIISWKDRLFNLLVCIDPFSRYFPLNTLFANDFIIIAQKTSHN